jgi:predicted P-loop ATPase
MLVHRHNQQVRLLARRDRRTAILAVKVGTIDIEALRHDRDQLFSEAVQAYRAGEKWWPDDAFEREHIKPEQEARYEGDAWQEPISTYIENLASVRINDVARTALQIETARIGTADQRRIASVLLKLGWTRGGRDNRGVVYVRPDRP